MLLVGFIMSNQNRLHSHGCMFVNAFIDKQTASMFSLYFENKIRIGEWTESNKQSNITKFGYYSDPLTEVFLQTRMSSVETLVGFELIPTYSYARIYQPGELLIPHVDRPACEVSITVNVASIGGASPIYTKYESNDSEEHVLAPGDAVVYWGCKTKHWRRPLEDGQINVQFMLHYVDKNGPNATHAKDCRPNFGFGLHTRSQ